MFAAFPSPCSELGGPSLACRYAALLRALAQHLSVELSSLLSYVRVLIFGLVSDGFLKADVNPAL